MSVEQLAGVLLIVVPVAFNGAFFALARAFDYPDILRREPDGSCAASPPVVPAFSFAGSSCF